MSRDSRSGLAPLDFFTPAHRILSVVPKPQADPKWSNACRKRRSKMKRYLKVIVLVAVLTGTAAIAAVDDSARHISDGMKVTMNYTVSAPGKHLEVTTEGQAPLSYV